ncbi:MAG: leucine-rich repeat domain-containing protein [Bacteroidota bacterium]|nr:MAG: leucine-rich repeat domain-containing protein [Bacteroidota bacterium]
MKRIIVFLVFSMFALKFVYSQDFISDGIAYQIISSSEPYSVSVTSKEPKYEGVILIPDTVTYNAVKYIVKYIGVSAFSGCGITEVTLPVTIKIIAPEAFQGCEFLNSINIPDSVTTIGYSAFAGCSSLTEIIIPNSVKFIEQGAFSGCLNLINLQLGNSLSTIGKYAFFDCKNLTSVFIPASVSNIEGGPFGRCTNLSDIIVSIDNPHYKSEDGLLYYENFELIQCPAAKTSINIVNTIRLIGCGAFAGCSNLASIILPDSVYQIGDDAFNYCTALKSIVLRDSVSYIGSGAFNGCSGLISISSYAINPPSLGTWVFNDVPKDIPICVPNESKEKYLVAEQWNEFNILAKPDVAGLITGETSVCAGQNNVVYSVENIDNAISYIWNLPAGVNGESFTNTINVDYSLSAESGEISVKGINDCGEGELSTLIITVNEKPETPVITFNQETNTLHSNAPAGNQWYNQFGVIPGETNQEFLVLQSGEYYSIVTLFNCSSDTSYKIDISITSIEEHVHSIKPYIFPNPTKDKLSIIMDSEKYGNDIYFIEFVNSSGTTILRELILDNNLEFELEELCSKGICFIRILSSANDILYTGKIIIE